MHSAEIRETFLSFFEERDHLRVPSASLIPAPTTPRRCSRPPACSRSSRTSWAGASRRSRRLTSSPEVLPHDRHRRGRQHRPPPHLLRDARQLRVRRLLQGGARSRAPGSCPLEGFGLDPEQIWIDRVRRAMTSSASGPDEEAIELWRAIGVPGGAHRPAAALGELLAGRRRPAPAGRARSSTSTAGPDFGADDERPGDDTERYLEYWNLVFMQYELHEDGSLSRCRSATSTPGSASSAWRRSCRTSPRSTRPTTSGRWSSSREELSGARYGSDPTTTRALRVLADHARGATFLIADGVVPSNEDRGYILRRIMRRAIQQGNAIGLEPPFLGRFADLVIEIMGRAYPELEAERNDDPPLAVATRRRASAARSSRAPSCSPTSSPGEGAGHVVDRRRGRVPPARHLRLPVRPDAGAARRARASRSTTRASTS